MREKISLDKNWRFALGHAADASKDFQFARDRALVKAGEGRGAAGPAFDDSNWKPVDVPHDWAIELPIVRRDDRENCEHGFRAIGPDYPANSVGWYRRMFDIPKADLGRRISIEFDGVFRDCIVWINGHRMGRNASGYIGFRYDITDLLNYGGKNLVTVRADATGREGWWYEGAGIYRHVWLIKTNPVHVAPDGVFVTTKVRGKRAVVTVETRIANESDEPVRAILASSIGRTNAKAQSVRLAPWSSNTAVQSLALSQARLWSPDDPNLYQCHTTLKIGSKVIDKCATMFGVRTFRWDAKRGFFLNGKRLKIRGTCNHQQHAGVGIALPDRLQALRVEKLKELGSNAYRASHYPATPELLDACDRIGLLVMAENRLAGSSPDVLSQFERMIRRDRNHPSIFIWSLANEEHTVQWSIAGERIGKTMVRLAHQLDPTRKVTAAMHDRGLGEGFANIVDVHGWNYIKVGDIEKFHRRRPKQPIVGSEEGSTVCTRGIYKDDPKRGYVSAYDLRAPGWGSTAERWWKFFADRNWLAGGFVWTGFDYYGEPIPYKWPCTASHFGLMDLAGFPKDNYYYFKSWWSGEPVLHLFPHWNWPRSMRGRAIDIRCFSNCDEVELFVNDRSRGRKAVARNSHIAWHVPYEPGAIEAIGYRSGTEILRKRIETTQPAARIVLSPDRSMIRADGCDVAAVTVSAVDAMDRPVPTAGHLVRFKLAGPGRILGVGNGDPSSHESDKAPRRKLFNGLALALIQSAGSEGTVRLKAESRGLRGAEIEIRAAG